MGKRAKTIRILLVDDHGTLRDSLQDLLNDQPGMAVVGCAADGEDGVRQAGKLGPDVVLMDINMPGISGLEATRRLKAESPASKVVILSTYDDETHILEAFRAGAVGYVPKTYPAAKMVAAIYRLQQEGTLIPPSLLPRLLAGVRSLGAVRSGPLVPDDLTEMEKKSLEGVKNGLSNKAIGDSLGVTEKTVRNHLNNAFLKLDAKTRTEAIVKALQKGILTLGG
jgi:DNA-binding NarL/FixJ family response regulator